MKGSELKKIAESLGRFASVRENAPFPTDRLIVQAGGGVVKVVATAPFGTLIATIHESSEKFRAVIRSRDFMQACKALSAKADVALTLASEGWQNGIEMGGQYFETITRDLPQDIYLPSPQLQNGGWVNFSAGEIEELARMVGAINSDFAPHVQLAGAIVTNDSSVVRITTTDNYRWATRDFTGNYEVFGTLEGRFVEGLRGIGDCRFDLDPASGTVTVSGGRFTAIGGYNFLTYRVPQEGPTTAEPTDLAVIERSLFLKILRDNEKLDKYGRVGVVYESGTIKVVPMQQENHGLLVAARKLIDLLMATSAKKIGVGLRTGSDAPLNMRVPDWTIELAPIVLRNRKSIPIRLTIPPDIYVG